MVTKGFSYEARACVTFGAGASQTLGERRALRRTERVLVLSDAGVEAAGLLARVVDGLEHRVAMTDTEVVPDADAAHVDAVAAQAKSAGVQAIVAVGGGSVIDSAKAIAAVMVKEKPIAALEGFATIRTSLLPVVAVPTTAGTGAEATQFCVIKDRAQSKKLILADHGLVPAEAVLDPELVVGLPDAILAATAVDALTHAVEAVASRMSNPMGDAMALEAIRRIITERGLERALNDPADLDARASLLIAAHLAGQAIHTNLLGACHGFAHALGVHKNIPHGVANGLFLVATMRLNLERARRKYELVGAVVGGDLGKAALAEHAIAAVDKTVHDVAKIPRRLADVGVSEEDVTALTALVMKDPDLATNPVRLTEPDRVAEILVAQL